MSIKNLFRFLFGTKSTEKPYKQDLINASRQNEPSRESGQAPVPSWHKYATEPQPMPTATDFAEMQAGRLVEMINESLDIAQNSTNPETRTNRLDFAEEKLTEIEILLAAHPQIRLQHVSGVRAEIDRLRLSFTAAVSFSSEELLRSQGALAEVDGKPTYALSHMKDDLDVMAACVRAETNNYWGQPAGHRITAAPFFFLRVAILQRKAKNYDEEIGVCESWMAIVEDYKNQDFVRKGTGAKVWLGSTSRKIEERMPKAKEMLKRQQKGSE